MYVVSLMLSHGAASRCRRSLSQRVATHNQRVVGEQDALAEEVQLDAMRNTAQDREHREFAPTPG